jgi:DNA-binding CsgD family transcriptional regulator
MQAKGQVVGEPSERSGESCGLVAEVQEVVALAQRFVGSGTVNPAAGRDGLDTADDVLTVLRSSLVNHLEPIDATVPAHKHAAALLMRAEQLQLAVKDTLLRRQRVELECAQEAVSRLRSTVSTSTLAERVPTEVHRMGFSRVLFSQIKQGTWLAFSAFAGEDRAMADQMVEVGIANPRRLGGALLEYEMVRRGHPILVRDAQSDRRVHTELIALTGTSAYVAAPVFSWGRAIGLVHADRDADADGVVEFDRDVLGMFAEGLGIAFERNLMIERLRAMRHAADEHLRIANALADDFTLEVMDLAGATPAGIDELLGPASAQPPGVGEHNLLDELTTRESEVLHAIAAGKTNAQIATALFVTEGTVKSHVKHILRKLNAGNRTEAVARYHQARTSRFASAAYG